MQEHLLPAAPIRARLAAAIGLEGLEDLWLPWTGSAPGLEQLCGLVEEGPGMAFMFLVVTLLFTGKADQTWVCGGSSFKSKLAPGPTPGCGDAVPAQQVRANCVLAPRSTVPRWLWTAVAEVGGDGTWGHQFLGWHLSCFSLLWGLQHKTLCICCMA